MIEWKNLDSLTSFHELEKAKRVDLVDAMSGEKGRERVKKYSVDGACGFRYNYAAKAVDDQILSILKKLAEEVARALKPEMEKLMAECEARVATAETPAPPTPALASTHDAPQDNTASITDDEAILPSQTFNFLKGLNDD